MRWLLCPGEQIPKNLGRDLSESLLVPPKA
jgi:hypothetical protein